MRRPGAARRDVTGGWAVFLIVRREVLTRVRGRVFVYGTLLAVALLGAFALLQVLVLDRVNTSPSFAVGFTGPAQALAEPVRAAAPAFDVQVRVSAVPDRAEGERRVRSASLDVLVAGAAESPEVVVRTQLDPTLRGILDGLVRQRALDAELRAAGLDPAATRARANAAAVHVTTLQPADPIATQQPIVGILVALTLYIFLGIYGNLIGQSVVSEKASRVVEVLLATVRPGQLLLGKVIGIGLVGLLQLIIIGTAALAFTVPTHVLTIPAIEAGAVAAGLLWFVLGFLLYALLIAAAASLVSRVEEVAAATLPVSMLLLLAWLVAAGVGIPQVVTEARGMSAPLQARASTVLSFFPPFTPVLMPIRTAASAVPAWQVALAVALLVASIAAATWTAARVYSNSVLHFGTRLGLTAALRGVRRSS